MKKYVNIFILLSLILASCKKDDTGVIFSLPAKTQTGQNTFGFLLNSSVWTNYGQVCFPFAGGCRENLSGAYYATDGDILLSADKVLYKNGSWNTSENFDLILSTNSRGPGTYSTFTNDTISVGYWFTEKGQQQKTYLLPRSNPAFTVTITKIDLALKVLSGEFTGKLFRRLSDTSFATSITDSIIISEGRFDIKLK
jgi:hypothetical protein